MVAAGGTVRIANGAEVRAGRIVRVGLPRALLPRIQIVEYLRAFLFGRMGWSSLGSLLLISGAFGIFEKRAVIGPPAKLSVRFVAGEALTVHFRITQDGRPVLAFPEGKETAQPTGDAPEPLTAEGTGSALVLSGLGAGSYVVEVTSEELVATARSVRLTPGETEEVEIEVQRR